MEIAKYFATLGFKVTKGEIKKVDDFLDKIEKGLKTAGKEADTTDKATKKVKKSTDEATKSIKQQLTWQEKLNKVKHGELKLQFAIAQNQKQLAKNFKQSVDKMVIKPSTTKKLKEQQALYDNLFGGSGSRKTTGATGSNQAAWNRQFNQRIQQLTQQSKVSRAARQADLDAVFGLPKAQSNPRVAALLNDRLGYLGGTKNGTLADMADMYRQDEKILKLRQRDIQQRIGNEKKLAEAKDREHKKEEARQRDEERWSRREAVRHRDRMQALAARSQMAAEANANRLRIASINASGRAGRGTNLAHAGGAAGVLARYGLTAIPFIGGVYGLSALNKQNQEIVSAEFGAKAIMGSEAGTRNMDWLREQANRIGFNWLEAAPEFTGFMGAATPLMGENTALKTFQAFNEFATTRHAPALARTRALMALKQMSAKGTIMSEELFLQLGEAQGFGELPMMFAEAYQEFLGGNLKGADAAKFLKDAMKEGKVKTADLMPIVTRKMSQMAAPTLAQSAKSSQSEQARFQNIANIQVLNASKSGLEEGFARVFRTLTVGLRESDGLVRKLASSFNQVTILFEDLILFPQSFKRALEGRDSLVADWLGYEQVKEMKSDWAEIQAGLSEIMNMATPPWALTLKEVAQELKDLISIAGGVSQRLREGKTASSVMMEDAFTKYGRNPIGYVAGGAEVGKYWGLSGLVALGEGVGTGYNKLLDTIPFARNHPALQYPAKFANYLSNNPYDPFADYMMKREASLGFDTATAYGNNPKSWRDMNRVRNEQAAYDVFGQQGYGLSQQATKQEQNNTIYMEFKVEASNPAEMEDWFRTSFKKEISSAMPSFSYGGQ